MMSHRLPEKTPQTANKVVNQIYLIPIVIRCHISQYIAIRFSEPIPTPNKHWTLERMIHKGNRSFPAFLPVCTKMYQKQLYDNSDHNLDADGQGIVDSYATPNPCLLNKICLNQTRCAVNSYSASHDNWCTGTPWKRIITAQCEGMGEVGSARYEPALLPPCPSIRALCYSNCQRSTQSHQQSKG